jgi:hypothetical protein
MLFDPFFGFRSGKKLAEKVQGFVRPRHFDAPISFQATGVSFTGFIKSLRKADDVPFRRNLQRKCKTLCKCCAKAREKRQEKSEK